MDRYERRDPERHCFFAYPEDYADNEIGYDDDGKFRHRPRRAAFEVIFVYRPDEGVLEVHANGGKKVVTKLMEAFCTTILGLQGLPEDDCLPFDLTVFKDRNFVFATEPKDRVASVDVQQLRLDLAGDGSSRSRRRLTLSAPSTPQTAGSVHDLIDDVINQENVPLDTLHPSQAKIRFTFKPVDGERPKTLTFDVTYPDGCTLKDDPHDQIAKKYLRKWGIARG